MSEVPCVRPWDAMYGEAFDVLANGLILLELIESGRIVSAHFGVPCRSMTWARWPQLRSVTNLKGLPGLGAKQQQLVDLGNELLAFTVMCCMALHPGNGYFSIENPERSWLWYMMEVCMLRDIEGVEFVRILFKDFGVPFYKPTLFLHNMPTLHLLCEPVAPWPGECITL